MRKILSVLVVAFLALVLAAPVVAENAKPEAKEVAVPVPEGMMAVVLSDGSGYILVPGSPEDLKLASDGKTIVGSRNPRGAQIIGHGKNLAEVGTESFNPPMLDDGGGRNCGESWCGTLGYAPPEGWACSGACRNCEGIKACP